MLKAEIPNRRVDETGALYTTQARLTADPSYYLPQGGWAFAMSLKIRPAENSDALTGKAILAASRHDFTGALGLTQQALGIDAYTSTALGVKPGCCW